MISLDLVSLSTDMPLMETICLVCDHIGNKNLDTDFPEHCPKELCRASIYTSSQKGPTSITKFGWKGHLKEPLLQCTFNAQFRFNNEFYRQTDGIPIGSLLDPPQTGCFMVNLENTVIQLMIDN